MANKKKEYKGKTIDEAIASACKDFDANQNELDIEVVTTGSAGIFGFGRKKAVILVTRKVLANPEAADSMPAPTGKRHHGRKAKDLNAGDGDSAGGGCASADRPRHHESHRRAGQENSAAKAKGPRHGGRRGEHDGGARFDDTPSQPPAQVVLDQIAELTKTMLQHMGIQAEVTITVDGHKVAVHILGGEDHEAIVGRDGSTLDAMQYLLRKIVGQKFPEKISLSLDAGTYRQQRQTELEQLALELAQKVKDTGKSQVISALNPAERRLVHVALQDDTSIRSASIGDGLFKKVRIYLPGKGRRRSGRGGGESSGQES